MEKMCFSDDTSMCFWSVYCFFRFFFLFVWLVLRHFNVNYRKKRVSLWPKKENNIWSYHKSDDDDEKYATKRHYFYIFLFVLFIWLVDCLHQKENITRNCYKNNEIKQTVRWTKFPINVCYENVNSSFHCVLWKNTEIFFGCGSDYGSSIRWTQAPTSNSNLMSDHIPANCNQIIELNIKIK